MFAFEWPPMYLDGPSTLGASDSIPMESWAFFDFFRKSTDAASAGCTFGGGALATAFFLIGFDSLP